MIIEFSCSHVTDGPRVMCLLIAKFMFGESVIKKHYSTTLNFGVLPLVEIDPVTQ